eukprot:gene879-1101_t
MKNHYDEENGTFCMIWGKTEHTGELYQPTPLTPLDGKNVSQIICGGNHSLSITECGSLYSWGSNINGQLGHGHLSESHDSPKNIKKFSLLKAFNGDIPIQVSAGKDYTLALTDQGSVYGWGIGVEGQLGDEGIISDDHPDNNININNINSSSLTNSRDFSTTTNLSSSTLSVNSNNNNNLNHSNSKPISLSSSFDERNNNNISSSYKEENSYHYSNKKKIIWIPKKIASLSGIYVTMIACGSSHALCLTKKGHVYSWGNGMNGRLGHGSDLTSISNISSGIFGKNYYLTTPQMIKSLSNNNIVSIACGWSHSMALEKNSTLFVWGKGSDGQLGNGSIKDQFTPVELKIVGSFLEPGDGIAQITCGYFHSAFISYHKRNLYTFGWGIALGHDDDCNDKRTPTLVSSLLGHRVKQVSCGYSHTLVVTENGECFSFGQGEYGQLGVTFGTNDANVKLKPTPLTSISPYFVESISCGRWHSVAILSKRRKIIITPPPPTKSLSNSIQFPLTSSSALSHSINLRSSLNISSLTGVGGSSSSTTSDEDELMDLDRIEILLNSTELDFNINNIDNLNFSNIPIVKDMLNQYNDLSDSLDQSFILLNDPPEKDDEDNEEVPVITKPFYDKFLSGGKPVIIEPTAYDLDDLENENELTNLWMDKFFPKFDRYKLKKEWKILWRKGFPLSVRPKIWKRAISNKLEIDEEFFSKQCEKFNDYKERYTKHKQEHPHYVYSEDPDGFFKDNQEFQQYINMSNMIRVDLPRTFPSLSFFNSSGPLHEHLELVLQMWAAWRPDVGYVQGMSYLSGLLTIYMDTPFNTFVCFANLLNNHFFLSLFRMDVKGIVKHMKIFDLLFQRHLPKLYRKFKELSISPEHYLLEWFMTLFTKLLPLPIVSRVWDCYLIEGESYVYSVAIGILKCCRKILMVSNFEEAIEVLRTMPQDFKEDSLFAAIESIHIPKYFKKIMLVLDQEVIKT